MHSENKKPLKSGRCKKTALRRLRNQKITLVIDTTFKYHSFVNNAHRKTLRALFAKPPLHSLEWQRIESLFLALGAKTIEGNGSRVRFIVLIQLKKPSPIKSAMLAHSLNIQASDHETHDL